ncbi:MAG: hypothetical protein K6U12_07410 [Armatimonadetes bacterium]|nr:hypothetical protein [Armatimonadota bacterium]CUU34749.1 hypothetical protein DCOP10_11038 [Armatimonadetes bacterium DC]
MESPKSKAALGCLGTLFLVVVVVVVGAYLSVFLEGISPFLGTTVKIITIVIATGVTTKTVIGFLASANPAPEDMPDSPLEDPDEIRAYRRTELGVATSALVSLIGGMLFFVWLAPRVQAWLYRDREDLFFLPVVPVLTGLTGGFIALLVFGVFSDGFAKWLAGDKWDAIKAHLYYPLGEQKSRGLNRYVWGLVAILIVPFLLSLNCYTRVTREGFYFNRFWSLHEEFYPLEQVERVVFVVKFRNRVSGIVEPYEKPYYGVLFRDGFAFETVNVAERNSGEVVRMVRWVSEARGLPIREVTQGVDWNVEE